VRRLRMKTTWYEAVKAYLNKLLPVVILLAFIANCILFYSDVRSRGKDFWLAGDIGTYTQIIDDYKEKPAEQAYEELKALNSELQAFVDIQMLSQNIFGESQETIDDQLRQLEEQHPGILARYRNQEYSLYSGSIETDSGLINKAYSQISYLHGYKDYIASMTDRMNEMLSVSIFYQKNTFAYRNIIRTPQDFAMLRDIPLKLGIDSGVVRATDYGLTDILMIAVAFLLCIYLIAVEKDMKLLPLVKSTRYGRGRTIVSKLLTLCVSAGVLALIFYGSDIMIAHRVFGLGDLGRYIQSISDFRGCTVLMTVGQYLIIFLLSKAFVVILVSLFIFAVILLSSNSSFAYAVIASALAAEWAAWQFIPVTSWINHLKFVNIFGFLDAFGLYSNYQNLNVFGQPANIRLLFVMIVPACIAALIALCYIAFSRFRSSEKAGLFARLLDKTRLMLGRLPGTASLFLHETYKLLIAQKALILLILLAVLQYSAVSGYFVVRDHDQTIYGHYLGQVGGELTDRTRAYIAREQAGFDNAAAVLAQAAEDLKSKKITQNEYDGFVARNAVMQERATAFGWITAQYEYLDGLAREKGVDARFIDCAGYTRLFSLNGYGGDITNQLLVTVAVIACLAAAFAQESSTGARKIIITCREGRGRAVAAKAASCLIVAIAAAALVYGAQFYNLAKWYGLADWDAPVQSVMAFGEAGPAAVPWLKEFSPNLTIGQYTLFLYALRLAGVAALACAVLLVSSLSSGLFVSIFASTAVLELPALLCFVGVDAARYFPLTAALSGNMLMALGDPALVLMLALPLCLGAAAALLIAARQAFCRRHFP
jgi:hypothetical protein